MTRWDERNAAPQCWLPCNSKMAGDGMHHIMAIYLLDRWGETEIRSLNALTKQKYKANKIDLLNKIQYYQAKLQNCQ